MKKILQFLKRSKKEEVILSDEERYEKAKKLLPWIRSHIKRFGSFPAYLLPKEIGMDDVIKVIVDSVPDEEKLNLTEEQRLDLLNRIIATEYSANLNKLDEIQTEIFIKEVIEEFKQEINEESKQEDERTRI